jgi:hypothetical protein
MHSWLSFKVMLFVSLQIRICSLQSFGSRFDVAPSCSGIQVVITQFDLRSLVPWALWKKTFFLYKAHSKKNVTLLGWFSFSVKHCCNPAPHFKSIFLTKYPTNKWNWWTFFLNHSGPNLLLKRKNILLHNMKLDDVTLLRFISHRCRWLTWHVPVVRSNDF